MINFKHLDNNCDIRGNPVSKMIVNYRNSKVFLSTAQMTVNENNSLRPIKMTPLIRAKETALYTVKEEIVSLCAAMLSLCSTQL